jgi:hypothetical protein
LQVVWIGKGAVMTNTQADEGAGLLPCPMCGGAAGNATTRYDARTVKEQKWQQSVFYYCNCISCGVSNAGIVGHKTVEEAQSHWNHRAPTIPDPGAVSMQGYDLIAHLRSQREWSIKTFGPRDRRRGLIDHLKKELIEIEAMPDDLEEWIDVAMLALDGAWQSGHTPEQVAAAFKAKLIKNQNRQWPDWRAASGDKAIEHVREEPQQ